MSKRGIISGVVFAVAFWTVVAVGIWWAWTYWDRHGFKSHEQPEWVCEYCLRQCGDTAEIIDALMHPPDTWGDGPEEPTHEPLQYTVMPNPPDGITEEILLDIAAVGPRVPDFETWGEPDPVWIDPDTFCRNWSAAREAVR